MVDIKENFTSHIIDLQAKNCKSIEKIDKKSKFKKENWKRPGGGGGITMVLENGNIFEKAAINTSIVHGKLTKLLKQKMSTEFSNFYACGISIIIHPTNPFIPTIHSNFRYFEIYDNKKRINEAWFGGGIDLTPYYINKNDIIFFHTFLKQKCDKYDINFYNKFKSQCDQYFYNHHRKEARGVGGIFYDYLGKGDKKNWKNLMNFQKEISSSFLKIYLPIVNNNKSLFYTESQKYWQELRRGRYVEFNLIHDKGTHFGIQTNGRIESIFVSLPPKVRWDYNFIPEQNSKEQELINILKNPVKWI
ncbi:MAG: oxygen-dependent coproporphyrinogen oxidase [Flavobacteriales bacterium]|nr:oxygen-dependent coproporphyrinogen oxidase [Flavobacteriales bacterium]|tara:strand:- start:4932 stop:5843 length:912 start_codon:yes stop_codon:yes gene_type:complete